MSNIFDLNWHGDEVIKLSEEQLEKVVAEFALTAEGEAKRELKKGRGVITGTLRRSIHAENSDYDFSQDAVETNETGPERGGKEIKPIKDGSRFFAAVGSGLSYALKIHQGWGSFAGYHYITNGVDKAKKKLGAIIARNQVSE